jgi:class 3 adenylate cyclase
MGRSDDRPWLPTGTVTFLFTDIEGSTRLLQDLGDRYGVVRNEHAAILRRAIRDGGSVEVSTEGDSFFAAFASPGWGGPVRGGRPAVYAAACNHR